MTREDRERHSENLVFWSIVAGLLLAAAISVFSAQLGDPYVNTTPHNIPHCSPAPKTLKDGRQAAVCGCIGMVEDVKVAYARRCWGSDPPPEAEMSIMNMGMEFGLMPPDIKECLEAVPDHCQVVANEKQWRFDSGVRYEAKRSCRTACKPKRCGCSDSPCKSHSESGEY